MAAGHGGSRLVDCAPEGGACGVDGETVADFEERGAMAGGTATGQLPVVGRAAGADSEEAAVAIPTLGYSS